MNCENCGTEIEMIGRTARHYYIPDGFGSRPPPCHCEPVDKRLIASTYDIPFRCELCGAIKFKYRAIRGVVFIWPFYRFDDKRYADSEIIIPENVRKDDAELSDIGIILSVGPGFHDKKRKGKWREVIGLYPGMKVIYDKSIPWFLEARDDNDEKHLVKICDFTDVLVEIEE